MRGGFGLVEPPFGGPTIWIVDPPAADTKLLAEAVWRFGMKAVVIYPPAGEGFLGPEEEPADAVLLGLQSGREGVSRLRSFKAEYPHLAVLVLQSYPHLEQAVAAMKAGATHVFARPFDPRLLLRALAEALQKRSTSRRERIPRAAPETSLPELTTRESDVLALIACGRSSKETGRALGISPRTVEVHRARLIEKFGARNTADLVRIALTD